jgi:hypothetical protein
MEESREVDKVSEQKIEEFYRDATADDVARVMDGQRVEARFRRNEGDCWVASGVDGCSLSLSGWYKDAWLDHEYDVWAQCQVYDPPAWFVNKPEPGEGWRLLEKFPPEELWSSDEAWNDIAKEWEQTTKLYQCEKLWYRRRIANSPTSSDSCRSRDNIPSGWRLLGKDEERLASDAYWSQGCNEWLLIGDDRVEYANDKTGKWHAIRQVVVTDFFLRKGVVADFFLLEGYDYSMPGGQTIRVTEKGFEVV